MRSWSPTPSCTRTFCAGPLEIIEYRGAHSNVSRSGYGKVQTGAGRALAVMVVPADRPIPTFGHRRQRRAQRRCAANLVSETAPQSRRSPPADLFARTLTVRYPMLLFGRRIMNAVPPHIASHSSELIERYAGMAAADGGLTPSVRGMRFNELIADVLRRDGIDAETNIR